MLHHQFTFYSHPSHHQGTPLGDTGIQPPSGLDLVRCIATARIVMPATVVRLSAGRLNLSIADQVRVFCERTCGWLAHLRKHQESNFILLCQQGLH